MGGPGQNSLQALLQALLDGSKDDSSEDGTSLRSIIESILGKLQSMSNTDPALMMQQRFERADADGSGTLTLQEVKDVMTADGVDASRAAEIFANVDADGNGEISQEEWQADIQAHRMQGPPPPPPGGMKTNGAESDSLRALLQGLLDNSQDEDSLKTNIQYLLNQLQSGIGANIDKVV